MADRASSAGGDRTVDVDGERLVVVYVASSEGELAELTRLLEGGGLSPVNLDASPAGGSRVAVPSSQVAKARRLIAARAGSSVPWLAGIDPKVRRVVIHMLVLAVVVLVVPLAVSLFFGLWVLGLAALGALGIVSAAVYIVEGVKRFFGGGGDGSDGG